MCGDRGQQQQQPESPEYELASIINLHAAHAAFEGSTDYVQPSMLRKLVVEHWTTVCRLAHAIHDSDPRTPVKPPRSAAKLVSSERVTVRHPDGRETVTTVETFTHG